MSASRSFVYGNGSWFGGMVAGYFLFAGYNGLVRWSRSDPWTELWVELLEIVLRVSSFLFSLWPNLWIRGGRLLVYSQYRLQLVYTVRVELILKATVEKHRSAASRQHSAFRDGTDEE